jgi:hypothetical protein
MPDTADYHAEDPSELAAVIPKQFILKGQDRQLESRYTQLQRCIILLLVFLVWVGGWGFVDSLIEMFTTDVISRAVIYFLVTTVSLSGLFAVLLYNRQPKHGPRAVVKEMLDSFMSTV